MKKKPFGHKKNWESPVVLKYEYLKKNKTDFWKVLQVMAWTEIKLKTGGLVNGTPCGLILEHFKFYTWGGFEQPADTVLSLSL